MDIFGIGFGEMFFLIVIGLVVIGPEKLPEMASKAGKAIAIVKAQTNEMKSMLSLDTTPKLPGTQQSSALTRLANLYDGKTHTPFDRILPVITSEPPAASAARTGEPAVAMQVDSAMPGVAQTLAATANTTTD